MKHIPLVTAIAFGTALLVACSGDDNRPDVGDVPPAERTFVKFSPASNTLPLPNDLLFSAEPMADGTMFAGIDPANPVVGGIDNLDGSSLTAPLDIEFSASLDPTQTLDARSFVQVGDNIIPNPNQNVFLLPLTFPSGDGLLQAMADANGDGLPESIETPTFLDALTYQGLVARATAGDVTALPALAQLAEPSARAEILSLDGETNNVIRITPLKVLKPKTKYLVVLTNINDRSGNGVFRSIAYETIRDPDTNLSDISARLAPLRPAIQTWERLASGYFGFMQTVFSQAGVSATAPELEDVLITLTFTTTAAEDILTGMAAPEAFFEASIRSGYKKDAITNVVTGVFPLDGDTSGATNTTQGAIIQTINFLLTSPMLPDSSPNALFNPAIAAAIAGGAPYSVIAQDASAAYLLQRAAAEAAISVHDSGSQEQGDQSPFVDIATEALGTVNALATGASAPVNALFPIPSARQSSFYRVDEASAINPALQAPAMVYQGQITLPYYLTAPQESYAIAAASSWEADSTVGAVIDGAGGNDAGTTPPSSKITYRYPFPAKTSDVTVPVLVTMPNETILSAFGITRPAQGWPVVIFNHGITTDRSASLPMANALAFACVNAAQDGPSGAPCFATIAIDQAVHGVDSSGSTVPGLASVSDPGVVITPNLPAGAPNAVSNALTEKHFNFTFDGVGSGVPIDYSTASDDSGSLFINLSNFANTRDHLRQSVMDLLNLNASLASMDVDADGIANDLDTANVNFFGHSLGGITGTPFVAVNNSLAVQDSLLNALPKVNAAALFYAGGGIPRLLTNSDTFAPQILGGLAAANDALRPGMSGLEAYLNVYQGVIDSVDPVNFAAALSDANSETGILIGEIIGNGSDIPSDTVIPNAADVIWGVDNGPLSTVTASGLAIDNPPAPFAGTEPLIAQFGALKAANPSSDDDPEVLVSRFVEGNHATPVSGQPSNVFFETIGQVVALFATQGNVSGSIVTNPSVVED